MLKLARRAGTLLSFSISSGTFLAECQGTQFSMRNRFCVMDSGLPSLSGSQGPMYRTCKILFQNAGSLLCIICFVWVALNSTSARDGFVSHRSAELLAPCYVCCFWSLASTRETSWSVGQLVVETPGYTWRGLSK